MTPQEIEKWARDIISALQKGQPIEDTRVELKSIWISPEKAAPRLAAHANSSRGDSILWLIGVDEKNINITGADPLERESWIKSVQKYFDGFSPRLVVDVNIRIDDNTVVALFFETKFEAPYVVKNTKSGGGYPEFIVPWREGTRLRAATRIDLLRILIPIRRLSSLIDEIEFNIVVAEAPKKQDSDAWGCLFRREEFNRAMQDGSIASIPSDVKQLVYEAYMFMGRTNQIVSGTLSASMVGDPMASKRKEAQKSVLDSLPKIQAAHEALKEILCS